MDERRLPYKGTEEDLKPDIRDREDEQLPPDEAIRREEDTYADTDLDPLREEERDAHHAGPDEHL